MTTIPIKFQVRSALFNGRIDDAEKLLEGNKEEFSQKDFDSLKELIGLRRKSNYPLVLKNDFFYTLNRKKHTTLGELKLPFNITFGIKTNFAQPAKLLQSISSIYAQCINSDQYEILIVGASEAQCFDNLPKVRFIDDSDNARNGRLGAMMNTICKNASYDIIVSMDDDILLLDSWIWWVKERIENSQDANSFKGSVYAFPIKNINGSRFWDSVYNTSHSGSLLTKKYGSKSPDILGLKYYVTGGMCLLSKNIWKKCHWDETRGFYQQEDLDWSNRLRDLGIDINYIYGAYVLHNDWRYYQSGNKIIKESKFLNMPRNPELKNQDSRFSSYSIVDEEPGIWPAPLGRDLRQLKNKYKGKRCFIIGNGPSLKLHNLDLLKNEITFGVNSIFYLTETNGFKPTFYVVEDKAVMSDNVDMINSYQGVIKILPTDYYELVQDKGSIYWFRMNHGYYQGASKFFRVPRFSVDAYDSLYCGQTVTYMNMQLAFYMGFTDVYLIGMDFHYVVPESTNVKGSVYLSQEDDPNHFDSRYFGKGKTWHNPRLDRVSNSYEYAKMIYKEFGRNIWNASIGGKLEIFDRVNYYHLFSDIKINCKQHLSNETISNILSKNPQISKQIERGDFTLDEFIKAYGSYYDC